MTPERWQRINQIFHAVLSQPPNERLAFLKLQCANDDTLQREGQDLLSGDEAARAKFQTGAVRGAVRELFDSDDESLIGEQFGAYRIVREIGRGGMGRVFFAERVDQEFAQNVAIKVIKRGMDTAGVIRRFRNERAILASLDHPNIARLFDGGTTPAGLPYFVMEFIEGVSIDRFCAEHRYSVQERLALFQEVCAAVSYAHQHLVVHRDIKPSNILVTADGTCKLLDFGLARLLGTGGEPDGSTALTVAPLMTPEYASPEQVLGLSVSTLTDVYSLGVVLYQLLTGRSPYELKDRSSKQITAAICEVPSKKPSA